MSCLSPYDFFATFDKQKLIRLAQFYLEDFSSSELMILSDQLDNYIYDVRSSIEFSKLEEICDLAQKMVVGDFGINFTNCDCHCGKSIFCYEDCEESIA